MIACHQNNIVALQTGGVVENGTTIANEADLKKLPPDMMIYFCCYKVEAPSGLSKSDLTAAIVWLVVVAAASLSVPMVTQSFIEIPPEASTVFSGTGPQPSIQQHACRRLDQADWRSLATTPRACLRGYVPAKKMVL